MLTIHPVRSRSEKEEFVRLPRSIYSKASPWVQPLDLVVNGLLHKSNPFFQDGVAEAFIVRRSQVPEGRIMAHVWRRHHRLHGERVGYFGLFECANDPEAAALLFNHAAEFAKENNCTMLRGPFNMTGAQEAGIVTDGFHHSPAIDMVYTAPWYPALLEVNKFRKCLEMQTRSNHDISELPIEGLSTNGGTLRLRCLSSSLWQRNAEMELVRDVVNAAFLGNWGFVPITREEWELQTGALLPILDPRLVVLATVQDVVVGATLAVPDFNRVFRKMGGRLAHPAMLGLFSGQALKRAVVILCAVRKQYQGMGLARQLNAELLRNMRKAGYRQLATTWIGGENLPSLAATDAFGMTRMHTVAMYERDLQ